MKRIKPEDIAVNKAVQFVIYTTDDYLFLVQERDTNQEVSDRLGRPIIIDGDGCFGPFGGGIKPNETPKQAAIREFKGELGIKLNYNDIFYFGKTIEPTFKAVNNNVLQLKNIDLLYNYRIPVVDKEQFDAAIVQGEGKGRAWLSIEDILDFDTEVEHSPRNYSRRIMGPTWRDLLLKSYELLSGKKEAAKNMNKTMLLLHERWHR